MNTFRVWLAEHLLHMGWAVFGQECDCGSNRFNWAARMIGEGKWTSAGEPATKWMALKYKIGCALVNAHGRLITISGDGQ